MLIFLIQALFAISITILNIWLQIIALTALNKASENDDIKVAKQLLLTCIITQIVSVLLLLTVIIILIIYRKNIPTKFIYTGLFISGILLLLNGSLSATVTLRLQCYRSDSNVYTAWKWTSMTAISGILGAMLMLVIKVLASRRELKQLIGGEKEVEMKAFKPTIPVGLPPPPPYPSAVQICKDACEKKASMPRHKPHYYPPIY